MAGVIVGNVTIWINWPVAWIVIGILALIALFFLVMLLTARFERRHIRRLTPIDDEQGPVAHRGSASEFAHEATHLGFSYVGAFRDEESNLLKTRVDLFLNEDGRVLLLIPSMAGMLGYRLITRMQDRVWLLTAASGSSVDHSGLRLFRSLTGCKMEQVLLYHRDRIDQHSANAVLFDPETLVDDLFNHDVQRAQKAVELGYARWVSYQEDCYTETWRGAIKHILDMRHVGKDLKESQRLAAYYQKLTAGGPKHPDDKANTDKN